MWKLSDKKYNLGIKVYDKVGQMEFVIINESRKNKKNKRRIAWIDQMGLN